MPKVSYTETKGLVQESGAGFDIKLGDSTDAHDLTTSIAIATGTKTLDADASSDVTISVPAGAMVIGGKVEVTKVDGNGVTLDTFGTAGDANKFGAPGLAANALGSAALIPTALVPETSALTFVRVALSGGASGAGIIRVTLAYIDVA